MQQTLMEDLFRMRQRKPYFYNIFYPASGYRLTADAWRLRPQASAPLAKESAARKMPSL